MLQNSSLKLILFYQRFLSVLKPRSCRFYPSCSEYAYWQFEKNSFIKAFFASFLRILRCNPYFQGGFDYPKIHKKFYPSAKRSKSKLKFLYIPYAKDKFYLVKIIF